MSSSSLFPNTKKTWVICLGVLHLNMSNLVPYIEEDMCKWTIDLDSLSLVHVEKREKYLSTNGPCRCWHVEGKTHYKQLSRHGLEEGEQGEYPRPRTQVFWKLRWIWHVNHSFWEALVYNQVLFKILVLGAMHVVNLCCSKTWKSGCNHPRFY